MLRIAVRVAQAQAELRVCTHAREQRDELGVHLHVRAERRALEELTDPVEHRRAILLHCSLVEQKAERLGQLEEHERMEDAVARGATAAHRGKQRGRRGRGGVGPREEREQQRKQGLDLPAAVAAHAAEQRRPRGARGATHLTEACESREGDRIGSLFERCDRRRVANARRPVGESRLWNRVQWQLVHLRAIRATSLRKPPSAPVRWRWREVVDYNSINTWRGFIGDGFYIPHPLYKPTISKVREGASHEGRRQLGEESRGLERRSGRVDGDVREDEVLLGARNSDVREAALLLDGSLMKVAIRRQESVTDRGATELIRGNQRQSELIRGNQELIRPGSHRAQRQQHAAHRTRVGERALAFVEAHAKDNGPLETLGAMDGAERDRVGVVLRDATLLQSRAIKVNQRQSSSIKFNQVQSREIAPAPRRGAQSGQSRAIKGNQGRSHLLRGQELKVIEQSAKPLAAALGTGAGSVR